MSNEYPSNYLKAVIRAGRAQALTPAEVARLGDEAQRRWAYGDQGDCPDHGPYATPTCPRCPPPNDNE